MKTTTAGISYLEAGDGAPVICLHGIGGGAESFAALLDDPGPARVISWDMPGYGESDPRNLTFSGLSDMLARFMVAMDLRQAHLVGHSIGGMVALEHAVRCPDEVASLTLIGTTPAFGGRDDTFKQAFLKARMEPLERGLSMEDMAREGAPQMLGPIAGRQVADEVAAIMGRVSRTTWEAILECLVTFNRREDLARVPMPCLLIAGSHDMNAPQRTMEKMAGALPDAEFHVIEGAGHMINQEAPDQVNALIHDFLRRQTQ